jgi:trehalose-6-phosphate synthase
MARMRKVVRRNDIYWWLERFLRDLLDPRALQDARYPSEAAAGSERGRRADRRLQH